MSLETGPTEAGLDPGSVEVGLKPMSVWADLEPGFIRAGLVLGRPGAWVSGDQPSLEVCWGMPGPWFP